MAIFRIAGAVVMTALIAAPASAQAAPAIPVVADLALLGAGVAGLLIGRFGSRSRGGGD